MGCSSRDGKSARDQDSSDEGVIMKQRRSLRALVVFVALLPLIIPATSGAASPPQARCQSDTNQVGTLHPPGFTPLTATPEELQCYGFPPRPATSQEHIGWESAMAHALQRVTPRFVTVPISSGGFGQVQITLVRSRSEQHGHYASLAHLGGIGRGATIEPELSSLGWHPDMRRQSVHFCWWHCKSATVHLLV